MKHLVQIVALGVTLLAAPAQPAMAQPSGVDRAACEQALAADPVWKRAVLAPEYNKLEDDTRARHAQDADAIARNERHVVMAYSALWLLTVGFLFYIWRRGRENAALAQSLAAQLDRALSK